MHPKHHAHHKHLAAMDSIPRGANLYLPQPDDIDPDQDPPGSRSISEDEHTMGGIPSAEARRARRDSGGLSSAWADRPTRPLLHAAGEMPDGYPAPAGTPPSRQRVIDLARSFLSGPDAQRVVGRAGCEEMARYIRSEPDYVALIDELVMSTVAVEQIRARGDTPCDEAMSRMDDAERAIASLCSLDQRFAGVLEVARVRRSLANVLTLDAPTSANVSDTEILSLARTLRDGSITDGIGRQTCIIALGIGGPVADARALARGVPLASIIAQARAWCAAQIKERAGLAPGEEVRSAPAGGNPDPIDGPQRYRGDPWIAYGEPSRNRARRAREQAGLSLGQAAKLLAMSRNELEIIEASDDLGRHAQTCDFEADVGRMADLYAVSQEWILGYVPLRDYARVDATRASDQLSPSDRDGLARSCPAVKP